MSCHPMCFLTSLHGPWHVPWRPVITGMTGRETRQNRCHHLPWLIALPTRRTSRQLCFVHNPIERSWHLLNFKHVPSMTRTVSTIGGQGLVVFKSTGGGPIRLPVCNPFTGQFGHLPHLQKPRTNPAA
ncbi:F-box domain, cyclin-like protein [Artemisia annua]|uniref:F-box domain, cyclin-like protein n=1 Tax=Artemisia annua TaxID=35608 RepID=A0A2U1MRU2_ARTAN|nr:F-box domain, cyclin-like protein [Artemisia annua]